MPITIPCSPTSAALQVLARRIEGTVLGLANGSLEQRVLVEYLKEVEARAVATFGAAAAGAV